jgi:Flp pilus assembly protein TadD
LIAAAFLPGCTPPGPRTLLRGRKLIDQGRYAEAIEELRMATSLMSSNAQAWNYLGLSYHYAGQSTNAAQAYMKALTLNQDLVEARYNLGCLRMDQDRLDLAKSELTAYTVLRRNSLEGWLRLAAAQLRSVRPTPGSVLALDLALAEKSYHEADRLSPQNPEALNGLGLIQLDRNRPREAAQYFSQALKQQPGYAPALLNLAVVSQVHLNDHQSALQKYHEYLALPGHPSNEQAVQTAARELERELNPAARASATSVAASLAAATVNAPRPVPKVAAHAPGPSPVDSAANFARVAPAPPQPAQKVEVVKGSAEPSIKAPQDTAPAPSPSSTAQTRSPELSSRETTESPKVKKPGFFSRVNPLNVLHRESPANSSSAGAAAPSPKGAAERPESVSASAGRGSRYHYVSPSKPVPGDEAAAQRAFAQGFQAQQAGHLPEAIQSYRQAAQLDPADYDAYYNLGLAATAAGNLQQALVAYEYALAIRPDSSDARYNFSLVLKTANCLPDAINELSRLLATYPREPRAHLALGNIYAQVLRQPVKARQHYLQVLDIDPRNPQAPAIREWLVANP